MSDTSGRTHANVCRHIGDIGIASLQPQEQTRAKLIVMFTQAKELSLRKPIVPTKPLVSKASMLSFKFTRCGDAAYLRYLLAATGSLHIDCRAARARRQSISVLWFVVLPCQCSISVRSGTETL